MSNQCIYRGSFKENVSNKEQGVLGEEPTFSGPWRSVQ